MADLAANPDGVESEAVASQMLAGMTWFRDRTGGTYYPSAESVRHYLPSGRTVEPSGPPANVLVVGNVFVATLFDDQDESCDVLCRVLERDGGLLRTKLLSFIGYGVSGFLQPDRGHTGWSLMFDANSGRSCWYQHDDGRTLPEAAQWKVDYTGDFPRDWERDYDRALDWGLRALVVARSKSSSTPWAAAAVDASGQRVNPAVLTFLEHFRAAGAIGRVTAFPDMKIAFDDPVGDPENEVFRASWVEDDGTPMVIRLTEGGIAAGHWEGPAFFCEDNEGDPFELRGFVYQEMPGPSVDSERAAGERAPTGNGEQDEEEDEESDEDGEQPLFDAAPAPRDIEVVTPGDLPVPVTDRLLAWLPGSDELVRRLAQRYGECGAVSYEAADPRYFASHDPTASTRIGMFEGQLGVYTECALAIPSGPVPDRPLDLPSSAADRPEQPSGIDVRSVVAAIRAEAGHIAARFGHSTIFLMGSEQPSLCAFTPLAIDQATLAAVSPYGADAFAPAMLAYAVLRAAEGAPASAALEQAALSIAEKRGGIAEPAYVMIQEGGSSTELYLHAWGSEGEAEDDRADCTTDGAYRTTEVVTVPAHVASHPAFYDVAEARVRRAAGAHYRPDEALIPVTLACLPDFEQVVREISAKLDTLDYAEPGDQPTQ